MACATGACSSELQGALWPQWAQLGQYAADASVSETIDDDTDLGLDSGVLPLRPRSAEARYFALATIGAARSALRPASRRRSSP